MFFLVGRNSHNYTLSLLTSFSFFPCSENSGIYSNFYTTLTTFAFKKAKSSLTVSSNHSALIATFFFFQHKLSLFFFLLMFPFVILEMMFLRSGALY